MKSIYEYTDSREYIKDFYEFKKKESKNFSHRYFESRLEISEGYFSRILKGEKSISDTLIIKFIKVLNFNKKEADYFENLVKFTQAIDTQSKIYFYERMLDKGRSKTANLTKDQYELFQEPHHLSVHALVNILTITTNTELAPVGQLLNPPVPATKIKDSLKLLTRLGLIELSDNGRYSVIKHILTTGNNPKDLTLRKFTRDSLANARFSLEAIPEKERSVAIMTISVSESSYDKIIDILRTSRQEINNLIKEDQNINRIYQVGMYIVPISKKLTTGESK